MIEETCRFFKSHGKYVVFDAEHFFDGMSDNDGYALEVCARLCAVVRTALLCATQTAARSPIILKKSPAML